MLRSSALQMMSPAACSPALRASGSGMIAEIPRLYGMAPQFEDFALLEAATSEPIRYFATKPAFGARW
jgi:hypothetical protein